MSCSAQGMLVWLGASGMVHSSAVPHWTRSVKVFHTVWKYNDVDQGVCTLVVHTSRCSKEKSSPQKTDAAAETYFCSHPGSYECTCDSGCAAVTCWLEPADDDAASNAEPVSSLVTRRMPTTNRTHTDSVLHRQGRSRTPRHGPNGQGIDQLSPKRPHQPPGRAPITRKHVGTNHLNYARA